MGVVISSQASWKIVVEGRDFVSTCFFFFFKIEFIFNLKCFLIFLNYFNISISKIKNIILIFL